MQLHPVDVQLRRQHVRPRRAAGAQGENDHRHGRPSQPDAREVCALREDARPRDRDLRTRPLPDEDGGRRETHHRAVRTDELPTGHEVGRRDDGRLRLAFDEPPLGPQERRRRDQRARGRDRDSEERKPRSQAA